MLTTCSLVSLQFLEDKYPEPPLLPQDLKMKALNIQVMIHSAPVLVVMFSKSVSCFTYLYLHMWSLLCNCYCTALFSIKSIANMQ
jgi:hypothetical protein